MTDGVDISVRALARSTNPKASKKHRCRRSANKPAVEPTRIPHYALIFDTETTTDELQQLELRCLALLPRQRHRRRGPVGLRR